MREEVITSRSNPLCAHFRKLAASRSYRVKTCQFLCDSPKLLEEALRWGAELDTVAFTEKCRPPEPLEHVRCVQVSESVMEAISPMKTPQGVVFSCRQADTWLEPPLSARRYLLLEGVQDPGNVGTILRSADAFGWTAVLLEDCADLYNPKTVRAAMGVHFRSPIWCAGLERAAELVKASGLPLYATALSDRTADVREADLSRCAVIIGSEGQGVSRWALELCDGTLKIPMEECCESLNAAIAAGIVLWEGYRGSLPG